jgi:hypothetical protein
LKGHTFPARTAPTYRVLNSQFKEVYNKSGTLAKEGDPSAPTSSTAIGHAWECKRFQCCVPHPKCLEKYIPAKNPGCAYDAIEHSIVANIFDILYSFETKSLLK